MSWRQLVSIDARALAATRSGAGLLLLVDLYGRSRHLEVFFSDAGVLPRRRLLEQYPETGRTLLLLDGSTTFATLVFLVVGVAAFLVVVGRYTRWAVPAAWLGLVCIQARNPAILHGGDVLLRLLLFWLIFLPSGRAWSLDARAAYVSKRQLPADSRGLACVALLAQVSMVYATAAVMKLTPEWLDGTAVWRALQLDSFATPLGMWLRERDGWVLSGLTWGTLAAEGLAPLLVWCPWRTPRIRRNVALGMIAMHGCFGACLDLGTFTFIPMAAWLPFLPRETWDRLERTGGWLYQRVAAVRRVAQHVPNPTRVVSVEPVIRGRLAGHALLALSAVCVAWNIRTINPNRNAAWVPTPVHQAALWLRLDQSWRMFSPRPPEADGWWLAPAELHDGTTVDLLTGERPDWERPESLRARVPDQYWRKYLEQARNRPGPQSLAPLTHYLTRNWDGRQTDPSRRVRESRLVWMREDIAPYMKQPARRVTCWIYRPPQPPAGAGAALAAGAP